MKVRFVKPEAVDPDRDRGVKVAYAPAKRQLARWRWYIILLVVSSPLLFFIGKFAWSSVVVEAPGFINQEQLTVRALSNGYVADVYVKPLQEVAEGDLLMRLADHDLDLRAQQLRVELRQLGVVESQSTGGELPTRNMEDQLRIANQQKNDLAERVARMGDLVDQGAATEPELTAVRDQYNQSMAHLAELYQSMAVQNQPDNSGQQIRSRILALRTELASIEAQSAGLQIRAPRDGRIVDLPAVRGDQMAVGSKVATLAPTGGELRVAAYIPPKNSQYAAPGVHATVLFPDGGSRDAEIIDVPDVIQQVPNAHAELFGNPKLGVLVRMKFDDADAGHAPPSDGLPVKVRFHNNVDSPVLAQWLTPVVAWVDRVRGRHNDADAGADAATNMNAKEAQS